MLSLIHFNEQPQLNVPFFSGSSDSVASSPSSSVKECQPSTAIAVIESALTEQMLKKYQVAYENGTDLDLLEDSMYQTWKSYMKQTRQNVPSEKKPRNDMLMLPKQQVPKVNTKKKGQSSYFVISSESAYKKKLTAKIEKERKREEAEQRKRAREKIKKEKENKKQTHKKKKMYF